MVPHLPLPDYALQVPLKVLQRQMITRGGEIISQVKVHWSNMAEELATWEDAEDLRARFPAAPAWEQVSSQAWRNISTGDKNATATARALAAHVDASSGTSGRWSRTASAGASFELEVLWASLGHISRVG